ncbi:sensory transduction histidine kinase [Elysia marginata]|uniref:Sensory transduction histidine kinase n=1 Tax=Elysia marginata TaxID=1093978 RepID=A0AAV4G1I8_9GAST|nr:sensory transduction histidine kinase [Elysia marginata]
MDPASNTTNISFWIPSVIQKQPRSLVKQTTMDNTTVVLVFGLQLLLAAWAFCSNIVNIAAFARMRPKDGVTWSFLALSVSDGVLAALLLVKSSFQLILPFILPGTDKARMLSVISRLCMLAVSFPLSTSLACTMVIAAVRTCCVTMPLKVRDVFTVARQLLAIAVLSCVTSSIYILQAMFLKIKKKVLRNSTFTTLEESPHASMEVADAVKVTMFALCLGVVFALFITLAVSLNKSRKFRCQVGVLVAPVEDGSQVPPNQPWNLVRKDIQATKNVLPWSQVTDPGLLVTDPGLLVTDPGLLVTDPGLWVTDPGLLVTDPGLLVTDPGLLVTDPGLLVTDPGLLVTDPGLLVTASGLLVTEPGLLVTDPGLLVTDPGLLVTDPGLLVKDPGLLVTDPGLLVTASGLLITAYGLLVTEPGLLVTSFGVLVTDPGLLVTGKKDPNPKTWLTNSFNWAHHFL